MAKKFVKQKLFCFNFAKNPKAVSGITLVVPETQAPFFGVFGFLAKKGHLRQGVSAFGVGAPPTGAPLFWPKSGGVDWGHFDPCFLGQFLAKKR